MGAWGAVLRTGDRQRRSLEINLGPLQITQLAGPEAVAEGNEDHGLVPMGPAVAFAPPISRSTSDSVRYSRVRTSAFLGRRGVTFRILAVGHAIFRAELGIVFSAPYQ